MTKSGSTSWAFWSTLRFYRMGLCLLAMVSACDPQVVVGKFNCPGKVDYDKLGSIAVPWSTGFETGFCEFEQANSFCYDDGDASHNIVDAPVHRGKRAAAFSTQNDAQTRCVLQGRMPPKAIYGAWFYLPSRANTNGNWNITHYQGGAPDAWHNLWDVSLANNANGDLALHLFDSLRGIPRVPETPRPVPIDRWFHVEFRLIASKNTTGSVALYQDGVLLLELTGLATVANDSDFTQWYIGNLTSNLSPSNYTLFVDDVTVRAIP